MKTQLLYGRGSLPVDIPDDIDVQVIRKPAMPLLNDPVDAVRQVLRNAVDSLSLSELAGNARSACIALCDITRPVPNGLFGR